eukprot:CAMPEP_0185017330 /NCGR_PEP_ID=MMETSP1103-20130426/290_1 /TAXON_ID=36769 /ORGANISM="Paraphysomonas bandaiensis, Strain Caron Lab Isolate" /LENGTH=202 /DNA_ID=CAMNT_0027546679 /DNA_START=90 /DNA_END=698 /DNA_ORIENTATION=-
MFNIQIYIAKAIRTKGLWGSIMEFYTYGHLKFGELKGTDAFGNKYYESLDEPMYQHRWVEYKDPHNFDPTMIQPEWHGWMHHTFDEVPGEEPRHPKLPIEIQRGANSIYNTHVYKSNVKPILQHNTSQLRQRGWQIGSLQTGPGEPDQYYLHDGHPLHPDAFKEGSARHKETSSLYDGSPLPDIDFTKRPAHVTRKDQVEDH